MCCDLAGNLISMLEMQGFRVCRLVLDNGIDWAEDIDIRMSQAAAGNHRYDWLMVDHYGLGSAWERAMTNLADRIFVIDDLGRPHDCHLLLDQNYPNPA